MRVSLDWLQDWVDAGLEPADLANRLTMAGFEVEAIERAAADFRGVVVAEILECARHPDADKLSVCRVSTGRGEPVQVVCGAPNARAGLRSALAVVGAELPGPLHIKRAKLRGVESHGMLCSARELGLSEGHEGILELPGTLEPGTDLRAALKLDDTILTLNVTPNRGDALSIAGVAREVAAITGRPLTAPEIVPVAASSSDRFDVRLLDPAACPKFAGRLIRGIRADATTPTWMQERLRRAGLRPISPTVDVTNYVMLELGQPMHAYDLRQLHSHVEVRLARAGERLTLLDGREVVLEPDVLVIADGHGPVALAGVMGGERSGIAADTRDVFLEVAFFTPDAVAGRARRFGLQTDASQRFERGVDPTLQERAIERATRLLLDIVGGEAGPTVVTASEPHLPEPRGLWLRPERVPGLLGVVLGNAQIVDILGRLGMKATDAGRLIEVVPPAFRFDIAIEQDLIEEVARIYGYDAIPEADATMPQVPASATEKAVSRERVMLALADRGYQEAITYSFVDDGLQRQLFPDAQGLALSNPISADLAVMRVSLWPGLVRALGENVRRQQDRVRLFEVGNRYLQQDGALEERMTLAGVAWGRALPEQWGGAAREIDFYDVKADLEALLESTGRSNLVRYVAAGLPCLHPGRSAKIETTSGQILGWVGQLHPEVSKRLEIRDPPYLFELDYVLSFEAQVTVFKDISKYPVIRRDLAIVVDESVPLDALRESVNVAAEGLLQELRVFDVYRGPGIDSGRKSIALGLILQETSRTLTDADADQLIAAVVGRLKADHKASIRE